MAKKLKKVTTGIRSTVKEKATWKRRAERDGQDLSEWVRDACNYVAELPAKDFVK